MHEVALVDQDLGDAAGRAGGHVDLDALDAAIAAGDALIFGGGARQLPGQQAADRNDRGSPCAAGEPCLQV
ncbi:hypothetical protein D3C83_223990 [compost metagenome]